MSEPWGDIPLFREIQRILASSKGPVNVEMASQVAVALATQEGDAAPEPRRARALSDAVRESELVLAGYTRLAVDEPAAVHTTSRAEWTRATLSAWGWLFEHVAGKIAEGSGAEEGSGGERQEHPPADLAAAFGQIAPLLVGIQVGTLVGRLAHDVVGRYDHPIPRDDDGRLSFVDPNAARLVADYGFDEGAFVRWLALGSAARHLVVRQAQWIPRYWRSLVVEVVDAMEIDVGELQRRMMDLQSQGPAALEEGLGAGAALPLVPTDRHRRALGRLRSFLAAVEGYAGHSSAAVAGALGGPATQVEEGMARHRMKGNEAEDMLKSILGVSLDRALEAAGTTFCAAVVKLKGIAALNLIWAAPDNLPSYEEIKDPFAWIERVVEGT
ncbi:MAG TPA: zinc-dependent metalloprotease [Actinomycetota bacterium]|nr:zinc-dependent metalloprotease [Actinomycetota bacterium]